MLKVRANISLCIHTVQPSQGPIFITSLWANSEGPDQIAKNTHINQGPVVQNILSLISSLMVKMFTVLVSTISNSQVFLLKKCE